MKHRKRQKWFPHPTEQQQEQEVPDQQNALVWDLLLSEMWEPLDQSVVCRLMCCSMAMQELVHKKCAGRMSIDIKRISSSTHSSADHGSGHVSAAGVLTSWPQHHALGRWLAKHARLCSSIEVSISVNALPRCPYDDYSNNIFYGDQWSALNILEASIAAGLTVAAKGPGTGPQRQARSTRRRPTAGAAAEADANNSLYSPDAEAAIAAVVAAASAAVTSSSGVQAPPPLTRFVSSMPSNGSFLSGLGGYLHLTSLQLSLSDGPPAKGCRAALASLKSLHSLTFTADTERLPGLIIAEDFKQKVFAAMAPALPQLTQLTHLALNWTPETKVTKALPASLVSLRFGKRESNQEDALDIQQLTKLRELRAGLLDEESVLPRSVQTLTVLDMLSAEPLMQNLQNLQHLQVLSLPFAEDMELLAQLPQLTCVGLKFRPPEDFFAEDIVAETAPAMARLLALKRLCIHGYSHDIFPPRRALQAEYLTALGSYKHLTYLQLHNLSLEGSVGELCEQLRQLPDLHELQLGFLWASKAEDGRARTRYSGATDWGPLWQTVPQLSALRKLLACGLPLKDADMPALGGATQLTCLKLGGCLKERAGEGKLRAAVSNLKLSMLEIVH